MKSTLKKTACAIIVASIAIIAGCHKDSTPTPTSSTPPGGGGNNTDNYSSMANFFAKNGVTAQTYIVTGSAGGSFTTQQGTVVTIPTNAFYNQAFQLVSGTVSITFKDIYKKSDMLLSNMPTNMSTGAPLKSGGEFFIKATSGGNAVYLANEITVKQPMGSFPADFNMLPFIKQVNDTAGWVKADSSRFVNTDTSLSAYMFSLYQFNSPVDSGSWCNSDNSSYFSAYPQTTLTLQENDNPSNYSTYVFLVFRNIDAMVHVYEGIGNAFPYNYAPEGLQCTVVAVGVKGGTVYSSFTPITIGSNQTVNFSMSATTTAEFKSALSALN